MATILENSKGHVESLQLDVLELDVTDNASVERAVDVVIAQRDRIDILVNEAGYLLLGLTEACTLEQAQRIFDTNFFGAVRMNRGRSASSNS